MVKRLVSGAYVHSNNEMLKVSEFSSLLRLAENKTRIHSAIFYPIFSENQAKYEMIFLMSSKERDIDVYAFGHTALKSFADWYALKSGNKAGAAMKLTITFDCQKKAIEICNTEPHRKVGVDKWNILIEVLRPELRVMFNSWHTLCYGDDNHYLNIYMKPELATKM